MATRMMEQSRTGGDDTNVDDLTFLTNKTPRSVAQTLAKRLYNNQVYTKIGSRVLIAVNPNTELGEDVVEQYTKETTEPLDSHIFQLASVVYFHLRRSAIDQSVVFLGDSGSGKSHAMSQFMKFMAAARHKSNKESRLYEHIQHTDALFKSFACAATSHHNEASRVGRYIELQFDEKGRTIGVKHLDYLFEKERVVHVPNGESNFHVFYQLLSGLNADERATFKLADASHYHFLQGTNSPYSVNTLESQFHQLKTHLKALGFNRQSQSQIFQLLASLLHLGNVAFVNQVSPTEPAVIKNPEQLDVAADFLGLLPATLEGLLTYKSVLIKREMCTVFLNADDAVTQRDDLAKCLYSLLFAWMLEHINSRLCKENQANFIGLLDLPGFQSRSQPNSFEGFLVNYANERLFNYCCFQVFEASNAAYEEDSVPTINIDYLSNQHVVHLLGKPGSGIVSVIDKQANRAKGPASDAALMQALARGHGTDTHLTLDRNQSQFTIKHFAYPVTYSVAGFMESNRAAIGTDFVFTFRGGPDIPVGNPFVAGLFKSEAVATETHPKNTGAIVSAQQPNIPLRQPSMKRARVKAETGDTKSEKPSGAAAQFQIAMDELFDTFDNTEAWFVISLLSNSSHSPRRADVELITSQVERYALANMAQRKEVEYTVCYQHDEFVSRYTSVLEAAGIGTNRAPVDVLQATKALFGWEVEHMAIGQRFTYLCDGIWRDLEENLKSNEKHGPLPAFLADDNRSYYSDDDQGSFFERDSKYSGSIDGDIHLTRAENQLLMDNEEEDDDYNPKTKVRKSWICFTWAMTWWIPSCLLSCCGMRLKEVRMAWREKVTLCILIFLLCASVVLFIVGINPLICPTRQIFSSFEISAYNTASKPLVSINGKVFDLRGLSTHYGTSQAQFVKLYAGNDVSSLFPMQLNSLCTKYDGTPIDDSVSLSNTTLGATDKNAQYHDHRYYRGSGYYQADWYQNAMQRMQLTMKAGDLAVDPNTLQKKASNNYFWVLLNGKIYDLNNYVIGNVYTLTPPDTAGPSSPSYTFMDPSFIDLVRAGSGKDITMAFNQLYAGDPATKAITMQCLNNVFYGGVLDDRQSFRCVFAQYILLALSIFLFAVLFVKFLASLQLGSRPEPEDHDKFIVCNVPCYTEGEESLKKTIDSLAVLKYDDKRKLLFIIADGMVMGGGNDLPTPRIVLDILGTDSAVDPEPLSFFSLGDGMKQHNMAKVYTGLYECMGHVVPYLVVVKVGKPSERAKPGNRGKRDSQMILMRFFNKVHYDYPMAPLELEMYHQIKNIIGVDPHFYEFVLMVDADTVVMPDALNRLVSAMLHDTKIMGLCGETALANEKDTWATMIQVYEYFISHHLAKAFESLFGSVTCLPGCFCMYRMRAINNQPLLISNVVISDYSENRVDTLHKKNLLHLGEDRYLTTLMLKHFPFFKMTFTPDAMCLTNAPDTWGVLLSQRRRWINSTIHNLLELVFLPRLCGFCCFSMRFVVFMDLLSTVIMPATLGYLGYLLYRLITDSSSIPAISLCFIIAPYALQMIVFILRRQWQHIGWMIVYLLALPVFAFFIPIYAFWHFDDFSWGNTRVVVGDNGKRKKIVVATGVDDGKFDPKSIPTKKWSEYEEEIWEAGTEYSQDSKHSRGINYPAGGLPPEMDFNNNLGGHPSGHGLASPTQQMLSIPNNTYSRPSSRAHLVQNFEQPRPISPSYPRYSTTSQVHMPSHPNTSSFIAPPHPNTSSFISPPHPNTSSFIAVTPHNNPSFIAPPSPNLEQEILQHVRQILSGVDLMSVTKKQIREQLAQQLNRDMTPHRDLVNRCIERALANS